MASVSYINTTFESSSIAITSDMSLVSATADSFAIVLNSASATTSSALNSATASASESSSSLQSASSTVELITDTTTTPINSATPSPSSKSASSSSLPAGAIGGIVAGLVVLILVIVAVWVYKIRRSKQQHLHLENSNESCEKQVHSSSDNAKLIGVLPSINLNQGGESDLLWSPRLRSSGFSSTSGLLNPCEGAGAPVSPSSSVSEPRRPSRPQVRVFGDTGQPDDLEVGHQNHIPIAPPNRDLIVSKAQEREPADKVEANLPSQQLQAERTALQSQVRPIVSSRPKLCTLRR